MQHPHSAGITIADALEQEQLYLMLMPTPFDGYIEVLARVSSTCLVTVQRNRYSVPCHLANQKVMARLNQSQFPAQVGTSLKLSEEPLANTSCYDNLNRQEAPHV